VVHRGRAQGWGEAKRFPDGSVGHCDPLATVTLATVTHHAVCSHHAPRELHALHNPHPCTAAPSLACTNPCAAGDSGAGRAHAARPLPQLQAHACAQGQSGRKLQDRHGCQRVSGGRAWRAGARAWVWLGASGWLVLGGSGWEAWAVTGAPG